MVQTIVASSAKLKIDISLAKPDCYIGTQRILMHCNEKMIDKAKADNLTSIDPTTANPVIITGEVFVEAEKKDFALEDNGIEVGMIQVSQIAMYEYWYQGQTPEQGKIFVNRKASFTKNPALDAKLPSDNQFSKDIFNQDTLSVTRAHGPKPGLNVKFTFKDHPNGLDPLKYENRKTGAINYIASVNRNEAFVTYFVARANKTAPIIWLGRVGWHLIWRANFTWLPNAAKPKIDWIDRTAYPGEVRMGEPPAGDAFFVVAQRREGPVSNEFEQISENAIRAKSLPVYDEIDGPRSQ